MHDDRRADVVIVGGGIAALETMLALHDLAADRVHVTVVSPRSRFTVPATRIAEAFSISQRTRIALRRAAADFGADHVADTVMFVDPAARTVRCESGRLIRYDSLILTLGAQPVPSYEHAEIIGDEASDEMLQGVLADLVLADLEEGHLKRVAFVAPGSVAWTLPMYELALLTARHASSSGIDDASLVVVTAEERPLGLFGPQSSAAVADVLAQRDIEFVGGVRADVRHGEVVLVPGNRRLPVQRVFALPEFRGPALAGVLCDSRGFVPTDPHGRVKGLENVFAAGDTTAFPVKQGGLAAQQAEAAAQSVAARHGCAIEPEPFRPVLRGRLTTGEDDLFLLRDISGGAGDGKVGARAAWWPPAKIAAPRLAPYLLGVEASEPVAH
jgi:sulfide:quinone oxidoreductase